MTLFICDVKPRDRVQISCLALTSIYSQFFLSGGVLGSCLALS